MLLDARQGPYYKSDVKQDSQAIAGNEVAVVPTLFLAVSAAAAIDARSELNTLISLNADANSSAVVATLAAAEVMFERPAEAAVV